jgi:murein DD-endopeptidase MepM/ murein hydrolase activator NlpD
VYGADTRKEQNELNGIQRTISDIKKKLSANRKKEKDVAIQMQNLDKKIDSREKEIENLEFKIKETLNQIGKTKEELDLAEKNITYQDDMMNKRLRAMYKNSDVGYLQVLMESDGVVDLLSNMDMVKKIFNQDVDILKDMKVKRNSVESVKNKLEEYKRNMSIMKSNARTKQKELEVSRGEMRKVKSQIAKDGKALERQEDALKKYADQLEAEILRKQSGGKYVGGKFTWPAPGYNRITSPFGYRIHPVLKKRKLHTGIDIGIPSGRNIVAAADGKVIHSNWLGGYGKAVMIDHGGGIVTLYGHTSRLLVKNGQRVKKGTPIAKCGSTGMSTGPHLHFEVRKNGKYVNPMTYLKK